MNDQIIITYVSPKSPQNVVNGMCSQLPLILKPYNTVEELFPLLSNPKFHTDLIVINIETFHQRLDKLDMFDIIHTLATLIKSTVYRTSKMPKPQIRSTKILVTVDETTDFKLIKEVLNFPDITSVSWMIKVKEDIQPAVDYINRILLGDYTPHPRVLDLLKPKKKPVEQKKDTITLTVRQSQILQLIQTRGASNKTIAKMLGISESTVKLHMGAILKKYGVKNRTQLAVFSTEHN
jgi:DNA-binding CsgD family transcriptional regulator